MNIENSETELRRLFSELRGADARRAPPFNDIARGRPSAKSSPWHSFAWFRWALRASAIAILTAGIVLTAFRRREHRVEKEMRQWAALSTWEASTDALLSISSAPWGGALIAPSDSLINNSTDTPDVSMENL